MSYQDNFAYKLGRQMQRQGKGFSDNPYKKGTYSHALWRRGFDAETNMRMEYDL